MIWLALYSVIALFFWVKGARFTLEEWDDDAVMAVVTGAVAGLGWPLTLLGYGVWLAISKPVKRP